MVQPTDASEFLQQQRYLLCDTGARLPRYAQALEATVRPGMVVLDLGAGSGVLSILAARAGARRVYAVEAHPMAGVIAQLATANGVGEVVTLLAGDSEDVNVPEPVDLIVTDTYDCCGLQKGGLRSVADAARRWLAPGGRVMPSRLTTVAALIEVPQRYQEVVSVWSTAPAGIEVSPVQTLAVNNWYPVSCRATNLASDAMTLVQLELGPATLSSFDTTVMLMASRDGLAHGLALWFEARLNAEVSISNSPLDNSTGYRQGFFPFSTPMEVKAGDRVGVQVTAFDGLHWRWRVWPIDSSGNRVGPTLEQSTLAGTTGAAPWRLMDGTLS